MPPRLLLDVFVAGPPKPKGSVQTFVPRYGENNPDPTKRGQPVTRDDGSIMVNVVDDNAGTRKWMKAVRDAATQALIGGISEGSALEVELTSYLKRPEGHYGTGRNSHIVKPNAPAHPIAEGTGDVDKLARAVLDALQDAVMKTDAAVVRLVSEKVYAVPTDDGEGLGARLQLYASEAQAALELPLERRVRAVARAADEALVPVGQASLLEV